MAVLALPHVRAYVHDRNAPRSLALGPLPLTTQSRMFALSQPNIATISLPRTAISSRYLEPDMCWRIESDSGMPDWAGMVEAWVENLAEGTVAVRLSDAAQTILGSLRTDQINSTRQSAGGHITDLFRQAERWGPLGFRLGSIEPGPTLIIEQRADTLLGILEQVGDESPGLDWWTDVETTGGSVGFVLHYGTAGTDRSAEVILIEGTHLGERIVHEKRRATAVVTVIDAAAARFGSRRAVEVAAATSNAPSRDAVRRLVAAGGSGLSDGRQGRRQNVQVVQFASDVESLSQRAEAVLIQQRALAETLDFDAVLANPKVQSLRLGDTVRVQLPTANAGDGLDGLFRIQGLEPHEETGLVQVIGSLVGMTT